MEIKIPDNLEPVPEKLLDSARGYTYGIGCRITEPHHLEAHRNACAFLVGVENGSTLYCRGYVRKRVEGEWKVESFPFVVLIRRERWRTLEVIARVLLRKLNPNQGEPEPVEPVNPSQLFWAPAQGSIFEGFAEVYAQALEDEQRRLLEAQIGHELSNQPPWIVSDLLGHSNTDEQNPPY